MDTFVSLFTDNKSWLLSGIAISVISIVANILTKYLILRSEIRSLQLAVEIKDKDGNNVRILVSDSGQESELETIIKDIKGNEFVDLKPYSKSLFFAKLDKKNKAHLVHKIKAKDSTGRWAYYFIYVEADKESEFLQALDVNETIDLEDYGKVVASCYGEEPTEKVKKFLNEKYGFEV